MFSQDNWPENDGDQLQPLKHEELLARCLGNLEFAERVLSTLQQGFADDLSVLEQHCGLGDPDNMARLAHRMKGASANAAAPRLHAETARIEDLARTERAQEIPRQIERLKQEWNLFVRSAASLKSYTTIPT